jgi:glycosyltransferase involved in cell wall biosynthesis
MNFTIGIVTAGNNQYGLQEVLASIEALDIPDDNYEVIVVGGDQDYESKWLKMIAFDETHKKAWITRKKNIITTKAKFENIVYMHDYIKFNPGWYEGFMEFGNDFDLCMTSIHNADGTRFRDWTLWPDDLTHILGPWNRHYLLPCDPPYDDGRLSKYMYFSGAYWIAKRHVMRKFPLDESLSWGESEDVKWSKEVREHFKFLFNPYSSVRLMKQKDPVFDDITPEMLKKLEDYDLQRKVSENPQPQ